MKYDIIIQVSHTNGKAQVTGYMTAFPVEATYEEAKVQFDTTQAAIGSSKLNFIVLFPRTQCLSVSTEVKHTEILVTKTMLENSIVTMELLEIED